MFEMTASYSDGKKCESAEITFSVVSMGSKILIIKVKWNGKKYPAIKSNFWHVHSRLLTSSFVIRLHIRLAERNWCDLFRCHLRNTLQPIKLTTRKQFKSISLHGARERTEPSIRSFCHHGWKSFRGKRGLISRIHLRCYKSPARPPSYKLRWTHRIVWLHLKSIFPSLLTLNV